MIDGERVLVFDEPPVIPPSLDQLLSRMRITYRDDFPIGGMSSLCAVRDHRLRRFREGRFLGSDGVARDLRLLMCQDCQTVCVRDVSLQAGVGGSRLMPRRVNEIIGWYTGSRARDRQYR